MSVTPASDVLTDDHDTADSPRSRRLRAAAAAVAMLTVVAAGLVLGAGVGSAGGPQTEAPPAVSMATVFPDGVLDLASVPDATAAHYRHAAANTDVYEQVRCYCGCEAAFDHRNLADCFIRADGRWEAHGSGCGICIAEAIAVRDHLDAGTPTPDIVDDINATFGDMTPADI